MRNTQAFCFDYDDYEREEIGLSEIRVENGMVRLIGVVNWPVVLFYFLWLAGIACLLYFGIYFWGPFTIRLVWK